MLESPIGCLLAMRRNGLVADRIIGHLLLPPAPPHCCPQAIKAQVGAPDIPGGQPMAMLPVHECLQTVATTLRY